MIDFDFSLPISSGQLTFMVTLKGLAHVRRSNRFLATDRLPSQIPIQQMRPTLSWKQPSATLFLSRSVPVHGIRAVDLPRESSRYRNLPAFYATQTLSCRVPGKHVPKHARRSQRESRLADLCRLRSGVNCQSPQALCQRQLWFGFEASGLCLRFIHHRFMFDTISMGNVSQTQSGNKTPYTHRPERLYSLLYKHYRWQNTRCQYSRPTHSGSGRFLYHGSRSCLFFSPVSLQSTPSLLYYTRQKQYELCAPRLSIRRQNDW